MQMNLVKYIFLNLANKNSVVNARMPISYYSRNYISLAQTNKNLLNTLQAKI